MSNQTYSTPQDALAHFGVKGMRWGFRKNDVAGVDTAIRNAATTRVSDARRSRANQRAAEDFLRRNGL